MKDPVFDASNPNPTIARAASTRRHSQKNPDESGAPPGSRSASSSTKLSRPAAPGASAAKGSSSKAPGALVIKDSKSLAATPSPTSSQVNSPTTASAARSVLAPQPRPPAFGSSEPRLPSHMRKAGQRGPAPVNLNVDSESPTSFENISTPADDEASNPPLGAEAAPPHRPSHLHLLSAVVRTANSDGGGSRSVHSRSSVDHSNRSSTRSSAAASYTPQRPSLSKGTGPNESITVALARKSPVAHKNEQEYPRLLQGPGVSIDVYDEPLYASVQRYHGGWDPSDGTEDPLAVFGAEGGELPGIDSGRTLALRDAVIRYAKKHRFFEGVLPDTIASVLKIDAAAVGLRSMEEPDTSKKIYSLGLDELGQTAHAALAVQQILEALTIFLDKDPKSSFLLDPGFGFLKLAERSEQAAEVRFALSTLQRRLFGANTHIMQYFNGIRETITGDASSEKFSIDSTITEVRQEFGTQHPSKELRRLMLRPEYYTDAGRIDTEARTTMLLELQEVPRKNYYHARGVRGAIPTMKEKGKEKEGSSAVPTAAVPVPSTPGVFGVRFEKPSTPPPRISAVTSLPGHGTIRNTADPSPYERLFVSGGPLSSRVGPAFAGAAPSSVKSNGRPNTTSWTSYQFQQPSPPTASAAPAPVTPQPAVVPGERVPPPGGNSNGIPPGWMGRVPIKTPGGSGGGGGDGPNGGGGGFPPYGNAMMTTIKPASNYPGVIEREVLVVGAEAHSVKEGSYNRNRRRRESFESAKSSIRDKGKEKEGTGTVLPRKELRKAAKTPELPFSTNDDGVKIHAARKGYMKIMYLGTPIFMYPSADGT
ncbi:hypothetical protein R3P38DRAFT_2790721 [Favolaschia claudopus]|uniref:Uncharacterized protein n=1 Tax=Favolaschia claudopus TaxID=2862362 RepID=A0AAW0AIF8_9AGAR